MTLQEVLEQYKDKNIYIDFWASWCHACCDDISNSQDAKIFLNQKNVVYLYFSMDNNPKAWESAVKKYGIDKNQYMLINTKAMYNYLNIIGIPRYLILNNKHQLVNTDAPRPNSSFIENLKVEIGKLFQRTVTYF